MQQNKKKNQFEESDRSHTREFPALKILYYKSKKQQYEHPAQTMPTQIHWRNGFRHKITQTTYLNGNEINI